MRWLETGRRSLHYQRNWSNPKAIRPRIDSNRCPSMSNSSVNMTSFPNQKLRRISLNRLMGSRVQPDVLHKKPRWFKPVRAIVFRFQAIHPTLTQTTPRRAFAQFGVCFIRYLRQNSRCRALHPVWARWCAAEHKRTNGNSRPRPSSRRRIA